jgi:hypothetical protein
MKFEDQLTDINYATEKQIKEEHWHVEGIIKSRSNQKFKFDLSPIIKFKQNDYGKIGHFKSKSEKIVFDFKNTWILLDTNELHEYIKETNKRDLNIDELLQELSWNIVLDK